MATSQFVHCARLLAQPLGSHISVLSCRTVRSIRLNNWSQYRNYTSVKCRLYSDKHEWVEVNGNIGTVGISEYAQEALGDVVFAQLPDVGTEVCQHDEVGALESVKAASELYSPVSGKIVEKNTAVEETPGLINKACYTNGWLFKIAMTKIDTELKELMSEDKYQEYLKSCEH
uniref:Glycine cleavage system H protein n=1 Tax=Panstrongylus lignarius TaxID=156445 RepID=A0A224XZ82_9HEMI